jgi:hypothetical protein
MVRDSTLRLASNLQEALETARLAEHRRVREQVSDSKGPVTGAFLFL